MLGASATAVSIAATLFGAVSIQMMLFYMMNWEDPDIRRCVDSILVDMSRFRGLWFVGSAVFLSVSMTHGARKVDESV